MRIGINGLGRIGRGLLKCLLADPRFEVAALNDVAEARIIAHLLNHDSYYGAWDRRAEAGAEGTFLIDGKIVPLSHHRDPVDIPWRDFGVDRIVEATGRFTDRAHLEAHKVPVLLTAVSNDADVQVVYGVNHAVLKPEDRIVSATSCTTHCVVPPLHVLGKSFGIRSVLFNTVHCYNVNQTLVDAPRHDLRRSRAGALNMIPTTTSAERAVEAVLPELRGKTRGMAIRVPAPATSLTEIIIHAENSPSRGDVLRILDDAASGPLENILSVCREELVSQDFIGNTASSIIDEKLTTVQDSLVRLIAWYDNEWGYIHRLIDLLAYMGEMKP